MFTRIVVGLAFLVFLSGCATTKNYSAEVDALNARVASLQNQIQAKDREAGGLSDQVRSLQSQLENANKARLDAERRLDQALARLASPKPGYDKQATGTYIK